MLTHAEDFVAKRLAPAFIANDGKQTPSVDIRYLSRSTPPPVADVAVWKNGIASRR